MPETVELCPVEIPGRGKRILEPLPTDLLSLVEALAKVLQPYFDKPFAFFGHSLGATISFELARSLRKKSLSQPVQLFVSARSAPQATKKYFTGLQLTESDLFQILRNLKGTPDEISDHPEFMQLFLPILQADFRILQNYLYRDEAPLNYPITAFGGLQDKEVDPPSLAAWQVQTTALFKLHMLPGDHFFLRTAQTQLIQMLTRELLFYRNECDG